MTTAPCADSSADYPFLRHALAALAYRMRKALRGAGAAFATVDAGQGVRRPHDLVWHMEEVIAYAVTFFDPVERPFIPEKFPTFTRQVASFHARLEELSRLLEAGTPMYRGLTPTRLLQGPIADAMTHAGQLALLRRLSGASVPSDNFIFADISPDHLGPDQPPPVQPG